MEAARTCGLGADADGNLPCRFIARNELRYALRSAERCVPWVRKVFIVHDDDNELPRWLNRDNQRLQIVRHSEIMPARFLPCFCPITIEHYLAQIPDLAERFLYSNDDMMFYRPLEPSFFFAADGYPYCRFGGKKKPMPEEEKSHYLRNIDRADELLRRYAHSPFVVTSRLHCALPCIAIGTPCWVVPPDADVDAGRFGGNEAFMSRLEFDSTGRLKPPGGGKIGLDGAPPVMTAHLPFAEAPARQCHAFMQGDGEGRP